MRFMNILKYTNRVVLFANVWFCLVIGYIVTNREMFQAISNKIYPASDNLMGSPFADLLVRSESTLLLLAIIVFMIIKEKRLKERYMTRLWSNALIGVVLLASSGYLLSILYPM